MKQLVCLLAIMATMLALPPFEATADVTVSANFSAGETDLEVDGFVGMAGDGWYGPWLQKGFSYPPTTTLYTPETTGYNPLDSGTGNYLGVEVIPSGLGKGGTIGRNFSAGIDTTQDHTINFLMRIEEDLSSVFGTFTSIYDQYLILDNAGKVDSLDASTSSNSTWAIGVFGDRTNEPGAGGYWFFHNYFEDGSNAHVVSDMLVQMDITYDIEITVHPETMTYDVSISDGLNTTGASGLGFRYRGPVSGLIQFCARGDSKDEDVRLYAIDSLQATGAAVVMIPGDTNNDKIVDETDAETLASNWGRTDLTNGSSDGDFNKDGSANMADASILAANWGDHNVVASEGVVPEPCVLTLIACGAAMLALRRRHAT